MDNAARMRKCHRLGDAQHQTHALYKTGNARQKLVESLPLDVLHAVEHSAILKGSCVMNRNDARMFQSSQNVSFAQQPGRQLR